MSRAATADLLLEHGAFLRRLARRLLRDEHEADDVLQEAWIAAARQPTTPRRDGRAWLSGVVRNLARRRRRTEGRRRRREAAVARPEVVVSDPATTTARLEIQHRIAQAVEALPEPGRTALVLRYLDDLTPTEIAERLGVGVRTVESRLRRARETLRQRLDGGTPGGRPAWMGALLPVAWPDLPGAGTTAAATAAATPGATAAATTSILLTGATVMSAKMTVTAVVIAAAVAFGAGRYLAPADTTGDEAQRPAAAHDGEREALRLPPSSPELRAAERALAEERRERAALEAQLEETRARLAVLEGEASGDAAEEGDATATATRLFTSPGTEEALAALDWRQMGESMAHISPLLDRLLAGLKAGEGIPPEAGEVQRWNGALVTAALTLQREGIPGTGVNGSFTHPVVQINLVRETLAAAGKPLDEAQIDRLYALGDRYAQEDAARREGCGENVLQVEKLLDEAALKERMFGEIDQLLTAEQRTILHPAESRGLTNADMFSSGVLLGPMVQPVRFADRDELVENLMAVSKQHPGFREIPENVLRPAAEAWAARFTDAWIGAGAVPELARFHMFPIERVRFAGQQAVRLYRDLLRDLAPDGDAARAVRTTSGIPIPVLQGD